MTARMDQVPPQLRKFLDRQRFRWARTINPDAPQHWKRTGRVWTPGDRGIADERGFLLVPMQDWAFRANSQSGVRPAINFGDSLTPGNNSKGTYVQLFTAGEVSADVWGILLNFNSGTTSTAARDMIIDIGYDPAGGTSYTVRIPDLLASCCGTLTGTTDGTGGVWYYFPLFFPSGCTIAARASVNNGTVGTVRVWAQLLGRPRHPELVKLGQFCTSVGVVAASSRGTTTTFGTTSEGAWTALGTPTFGGQNVACWWWQIGMGVNDATMSVLSHFIDLSYDDGAGNNRILIEDELVTTTAAEALNKGLTACQYESISPAGLVIEGRGQCSGTADANLSLAAYGVGG